VPRPFGLTISIVFPRCARAPYGFHQYGLDHLGLAAHRTSTRGLGRPGGLGHLRGLAQHGKHPGLAAAGALLPSLLSCALHTGTGHTCAYTLMVAEMCTEVIVISHCHNSDIGLRCCNSDQGLYYWDTVIRQWPWIPLLPLVLLLHLFSWLPWWRHRPCSSVKNTFEISVHSKQYTFPILLDSRREDKRFWTAWQQALPEFSLLLIS
jgi:hypothetical protein